MLRKGIGQRANLKMENSFSKAIGRLFAEIFDVIFSSACTKQSHGRPQVAITAMQTKADKAVRAVRSGVAVAGRVYAGLGSGHPAAPAAAPRGGAPGAPPPRPALPGAFLVRES